MPGHIIKAHCVCGFSGTVQVGFEPPSAEYAKQLVIEVESPGNADQERVILTNIGTLLIDMEGSTLSDGDGNTYRFPKFRLWTGGGVTIHTRVGMDGSPPANLYWGRWEPVWSTGERLVLTDDTGSVIVSTIVGQ